MLETVPSIPRNAVGDMSCDKYSELEFLVSHDLSRFYWKAYQWLGNVHDAEDAVQDALLSAYQHLPEFEGRSRLSTWLTSIIINAARLQLRRKRVSKAFIDPQTHVEDDLIHVAEAIPDKRPGPHEIAADAEIQDLVGELIQQLSPPLRKTLLLYYAGGMTLSEVAGILEIPVGTVKARISRAKSKLKLAIRPTLISSGPHST